MRTKQEIYAKIKQLELRQEHEKGFVKPMLGTEIHILRWVLGLEKSLPFDST